MSFALTGTNNFSSITPSNAIYTYATGDSITLTAIKTNSDSSVYTSNFFRYTANPPNVLSITGSTTNSITFSLTNMVPGSVRITATVINNLAQIGGEFSYTINLRKANYPINAPPLVYAITNRTNLAFTVVTYAAQSDNRSTYLSTAILTNGSGNARAGIDANGTVTVTNSTVGTSIIALKLTSPNYADYMVHLQSVVTPVPIMANSSLQDIIGNGRLTGFSTITNALVANILPHLTGSENYDTAEIGAIFATETGSGDYSGTTWANSIAATNLQNRINNLWEAWASKVYVVLVAGGTYNPTYVRNRYTSFKMRNHVAIIGGFAATGSWELTGTTTFSGDIGTANDNTDNTYNVFRHNSVTLDNALLYGVTISDGRANGNVANQSSGGGMYNNTSSPRLIKVVFTGNSAVTGGGMYNDLSSPVLTSVVFSNNSADHGGGGMFNQRSSAPVLTGVVFTGNSARRNGGGMNNVTSSPVLIGVVFTGNSARDGGGGMYNYSSSPVLTGVVFSNNSATGNGGGMYNDNGANPGPLIVNTIFAGNTAPTGQDIGMDLAAAEGESIRIAGSVLGITLANPTNGVVGVGNTGALNLTYHNLTNTAVNFGADMTSGGLTYPTIPSSSSAKDLGLYVRRSGTDYYFSENTTAWHTNFTATGGFGTAVPLPGGAEDLTATDIAGNPRVGRPDAGVYEVR